MQKSAGSKVDVSENYKSSFILRDRCRDLTIRDYIELVCEDNFDVLISKGIPDRDALNEAKMAILSEFGILSGGAESDTAKAYDKIIRLRAQIEAIGMTTDIMIADIDGGCFSEGCRILQMCGVSVRTWKFETIAQDIKRALAFMKTKEARLKVETERYNNLASRSEGAKLTESDIRNEMSAISAHLKYGISDDCNLATYAAHRKSFIAYVKSMQKLEHKTKNR